MEGHPLSGTLDDLDLATAALIHLLLEAPSNPLALSTKFLKGSAEKDGLDHLLQFAKRDYRPANLPPDNALGP